MLFTLYTPAYTTIVSVTVIFLFLSYGIPIVLGLFAYGRSWTNMGPWNMGPLFRVVAALVGLCVVMIFLIGIQPPNTRALPITLIFLGLTAAVWFGLERRRFQGPPNMESIRTRKAELDAVRPAGTD